MPTRKDEKDTSLKITEIMKVGPRVPRIKGDSAKDWEFLIYELKKLKVTPGEAFRIIAQKKGDTDMRFQWKMMRLTMFVWERMQEDKGMYLKPKIDTVRSVVGQRKFEQFFRGYFPDLEFDHAKEVKLLNKLIAEKSVRPYFKEGYYNYEGKNTKIPQKVLDRILWSDK
tara:strand:- start:397 stop:903 length:507 start_codon:yes stop_codon:yes gene_type:complete